tara:strand:- start:334 stop:714 length:381 start_codon:yes stop_codon:yes gene_type:complete
MREYECPYDENVLVRVMEPKDGMAYVYARQLFNQNGNVFHVVQSRNPSIILVDGEWADQPWVTEAEVSANVAVQVVQLYLASAGPRISSKLAYEILQKNGMLEAAQFVKENISQQDGEESDKRPGG